MGRGRWRNRQCYGVIDFETAMMPYAILPLVAVVVLTIRYVRSTDASPKTKWIVGCLTATSFLALYFFPHVLVLLLQVAICVYIILFETVLGSSAERTPESPPGSHRQPNPSITSNSRDRSD